MSPIEAPPIHCLSSRFPLFSIEVRRVLPMGWERQIREVLINHGKRSELDGLSVTSRENEFSAEGTPEVAVVDGETIIDELPWLLDLYTGPFLSLANRCSERQYITSPDPRSAININGISRGSRYEWHVDSNPLTGLLFCTSHEEGHGGALVFRPDPRALGGEPESSWEERIAPSAGNLLFFDGRQAVHIVEAPVRDQLRISVPMNFYSSTEGMSRPSDLDRYLYGNL